MGASVSLSGPEWHRPTCSCPSCCCPCPFTFGPGRREKSYSYEYCNDPSDHSDHFFKVVLIGANSGKTCLRNRIVEERWTPNPRPTVGIDYNVRKLDVAGQLLKLQICDFSGDERFLRITLSYLRLADGVLLVYDVTNRETLDHLVALMSRDDVRDHLPRSVRLMLIGNKADCDDAIREVSQDEGQNFANQLGIPYLETSAKTGWNVLRTVYLLCTNMMLQSSRSKGAPPGRGVTWSSRTIKTSLSPSPPPASRDGVGALANERTPSSEGYASAQEVFDSDEEEVGETVPLKSRTWSPLSRKKKEIDLSEWCNPLDIPRSPSPRRILRSPLTSPAH